MSCVSKQTRCKYTHFFWFVIKISLKSEEESFFSSFLIKYGGIFEILHMNERCNMKPKIRYFCVACQRPKMLSETQEEADRFIAFNRDEMLRGRRKAPVRSYYYEICGGWHVTNNPSKEDAKRLDERDKALAEEVDRRFKMPVWHLKRMMLHYIECKLLVKLHLFRCNFCTIYFLRSD